MPAQRIHKKIPKFHEAHLGPGQMAKPLKFKLSNFLKLKKPFWFLVLEGLKMGVECLHGRFSTETYLSRRNQHSICYLRPSKVHTKLFGVCLVTISVCLFRDSVTFSENRVTSRNEESPHVINPGQETN